MIQQKTDSKDEVFETMPDSRAKLGKGRGTPFDILA